MSCPGPRSQGKSKLRKVLQEKEITQISAIDLAQPAIERDIGSSQTIGHLQYVLCSPHFDDIVLIHPPNIDSCNITDNYHVPSFKEVRNLYFKTLKRLQHSPQTPAQSGSPIIDPIKLIL